MTYKAWHCTLLWSEEVKGLPTRSPFTVICSRRCWLEEDACYQGDEVCKFMHHSSLQRLCQCSSAQARCLDLFFRFIGTPCCQNSFVILPRCFEPVEHAWRHRHVLDLFASSSSLGFCLIRLQHHTDIFRVHRHRDKPQREAEMSVPPQRSHRYHAAASTLCFHTCILKRFRTS